MPSLQLWRPRSQLWRTSLAAAALVAVAGCAGCGGETPGPAGSGSPAEPVEPATDENRGLGENQLLVNGQVRCDQDVSSDEAKGTIERVGGLRSPTWSVRFAESTAAGVVVVVTGDLEDAESKLFDDYGVAAIIGSSEDQARPDDFRDVREAVSQICR